MTPVQADILTLERAAFDKGVRAMREHCAQLVHRWWDRPIPSRYRADHPHILEVAIRKVKPEHVEGRP